jgi:hypothetical protein
MDTIRMVTAPPVLVFGVAVFAFGGWIACESGRGPGKPRAGAQHRSQPEDAPEPHFGRPPEAMLGIVHVGTPRAIIERDLSVLPPPDVEPIDLSSGAPVLRVRYRLHLPRFVPQLLPGTHPIDFRPGPYLLTMEFDGQQRGHPLTRAELTSLTPGSE